jgi:hypothetical protein
MDDYFTIQTLYYALRDLLEHEGEREINGIGLEFDSESLEHAKINAREILDAVAEKLNL